MEEAAQLHLAELPELDLIQLHLLVELHTQHKVAEDAEDKHQIIQDHQELTMEDLEDLAEVAEEEAITLQLTILEDRVVNQVYQIRDQI